MTLNLHSGKVKEIKVEAERFTLGKVPKKGILIYFSTSLIRCPSGICGNECNDLHQIMKGTKPQSQRHASLMGGLLKTTDSEEASHRRAAQQTGNPFAL